MGGIIRGCIGFGFSAILVASTSFWLPPTAVVNLAVLLEIVASLGMWRGIKNDIKIPLLLPLIFGALLTTFVGTWLLATLTPIQFQWIIGIYLITIALLTLSRFEFGVEAKPVFIFLIGLVTGFFNGLSASGGIAAAWGFVGFKLPVKDIRATLALFFIFVEILFLIGSYLNDLLNSKIFITTLVLTIPLLLGILIGSRMFSYFSEATLKRFVLIALILLSLLGLYKTIF